MDETLDTATAAAAGEIRISAKGLSAGYGQRPVIRDVSFDVRSGEIVALLGPNGAGKSTTLSAIAGELSAMEGEVECLGHSGRASLHRRARSGMSFVPEERSVFSGLTVAENLAVGKVKSGDAVAYFPELGKLLKRRAGLLSGGEQQMLTLARALARKPRVLLADELSLGLAPLVVDRLLATVRRAADEGIAVLLVEQHSRKALSIANHAHVMRQGRIVLSGTATDLSDRADDVQDAYLGKAVSG